MVTLFPFILKTHLMTEHNDYYICQPCFQSIILEFDFHLQMRIDPSRCTEEDVGLISELSSPCSTTLDTKHCEKLASMLETCLTIYAATLDPCLDCLPRLRKLSPLGSISNTFAPILEKSLEIVAAILSTAVKIPTSDKIPIAMISKVSIARSKLERTERNAIFIFSKIPMILN